jgi:phage baseplate assembly protein W
MGILVETPAGSRIHRPEWIGAVDIAKPRKK